MQIYFFIQIYFESAGPLFYYAPASRNNRSHTHCFGGSARAAGVHLGRKKHTDSYQKKQPETHDEIFH